MAVAAIATHFGWFARLGSDQQWLQFLASTGAVLLTFLAGAELDPAVIRTKLTEVSVVGLVGFAAPFLVCAAVAHWLLGWDSQASLLAGVALSTTSMAVVYSVMLETGFNRTDFGKGILGACFINDLGHRDRPRPAVCALHLQDRRLHRGHGRRRRGAARSPSTA